MSTPTQNSIGASDVPLSGVQYIDALVVNKWGGPQGTGVSLDYSFPGYPDSTPSYSTAPGNYTGITNEWTNGGPVSWSPLSLLEVSAATQALTAWANVADITLNRVDDTDTRVGDIRFARSSYVDQQDNTVAYNFSPGPYPIAGDIWFGNADFNKDAFPEVPPGSYDFQTLLHEIGHAMGLQHPHQDGHDAFTLQETEETMVRTVMSYEYGYSFSFQPTTPMLYDVAAIQYLYGPNTSYHAGDSTYTYDGAGQYFETIWDAGGIDTIVYTGNIYTNNYGGTIDLRQGAASELGQALGGFRFDPATGAYLGGFTEPRTVWIAFGTVIENATGGGSNDHITGNSADNLLRGQPGNDVIFGLDGEDSLHGGSGNDTIDGGADNDAIYGGGHNDSLDGGNGMDFISGGAGRDFIEGGNGNDTLNGDYEEDTLHGGAGEDSLYGGEDADHLFGDAGNDTLLGGSVNDYLDGGASSDWMDGGAGDDSVFGGTGDDTLLGAEGNDTLGGGPGIDGVYGGTENDFIFGGKDADFLDGGADNDSLYGGDGFDQLQGGEGNDFLWGGLNGDTLSGGNGDDTLNGETGHDSLEGNAGNDSLVGAFGNDEIRGGQGDDDLRGSRGTDLLVGDEGADALNGGMDNDVLWGSEGNDWFMFDQPGGAFGSGVDRVMDFTPGEDLLVFAAGVDGTDIAAAPDLLDHLSSDGAGGTLIDLGPGNSIDLVDIDPLSLSAGDFLII